MPDFIPRQNGENIVFISGGSGAGKQETINRILQTLNQPTELLWFSVSYTTRQPRPNEVDGVHYRFVTEERFTELVEQDFFVEYNTLYGKAWYGTPRQPILDALGRHQVVIGDADVQGIADMKKEFPLAAFFFLYATEDELERRIKARGGNTADIAKRVAESRAEMQVARALYPERHIVPSLTVLDGDGNVTLQGIQDAVDEILSLLQHHAMRYWGASNALYALSARLPSLYPKL